MVQEFIVKHLSTELMTADTLTEALSGPAFIRHQIHLLNLSPSSASLLSSKCFHFCHYIEHILRLRIRRSSL